MKIILPYNSFSFFKNFFILIFLLFSLIFPKIAIYSFSLVVIVGKVHSLGTWFAMWRAGKLNIVYVCFVFVMTLLVSYYVFNFSNLTFLTFLTFVLFTVHFFYDEFILQDVTKDINNVLSVLNPTILTLSFLINDFLHLNISLNIFIAITTIFLFLELIFLKEINWFFISNKIMIIFILTSLYLDIKASYVLIIFLITHYFFWFIYPVYKLHKYKRDERDGFIFMLLLISFSFLYFGQTTFFFSGEALDLTTKIFLIGTIVHVFSTAPFGYLIGLPKPKYGIS